MRNIWAKVCDVYRDIYSELDTRNKARKNFGVSDDGGTHPGGRARKRRRGVRF